MTAPCYRTIVADPPWQYDAFPMGHGDGFVTRELPYNGMALPEIAALPVADYADPAGAALFLWTTNAYLDEAFDVMTAWGFKYRQTLVWRKTNPHPVGGSLASNAEFLLVGRRGAHRWTGRWPSAVIDAPSREHSQKPEVFMDLIEGCSPGPYFEMFSRRARIGWDTWGNQSLGHVELEALGT